ncbi:MAG: hypothetical protein OES10_06865 [Gammaproteobacteria bacterium]|nr:hypothetical protein [Gammaproteobacteria bacterium]MDH3750181.1 hypothetical protein [Gammaproteobacteria bacterium]
MAFSSVYHFDIILISPRRKVNANRLSYVKCYAGENRFTEHASFKVVQDELDQRNEVMRANVERTSELDDWSELLGRVRRQLTAAVTSR